MVAKKFLGLVLVCTSIGLTSHAQAYDRQQVATFRNQMTTAASSLRALRDNLPGASCLRLRSCRQIDLCVTQLDRMPSLLATLTDQITTFEPVYRRFAPACAYWSYQTTYLPSINKAISNLTEALETESLDRAAKTQELIYCLESLISILNSLNVTPAKISSDDVMKIDPEEDDEVDFYAQYKSKGNRRYQQTKQFGN